MACGPSLAENDATRISYEKATGHCMYLQARYAFNLLLLGDKHISQKEIIE